MSANREKDSLAKKRKYYVNPEKKKQAVKKRYNDKNESMRQYSKEKYLKSRISETIHQKAKYQENSEVQLTSEMCKKLKSDSHLPKKIVICFTESP